jgi:serine/threonine protein kinase
MAPELWRGAVLSARSDVWAIGATIAAMLSGPSGTQPPPTTTSQPLGRVVARALAEDPEQRYASAVEMLPELEACRLEFDRSRPPR